MWPYFGLLIPLAPFFIAALAIWTSHQRRMLQMQSQIAAEKAAQYATRNTDLEERVRVLERIVTDKGYDVAAQIEALRDQREVEARQEEQVHQPELASGRNESVN